MYTVAGRTALIFPYFSAVFPFYIVGLLSVRLLSLVYVCFHSLMKRLFLLHIPASADLNHRLHFSLPLSKRKHSITRSPNSVKVQGRQF
jgi:hypothetical protein